MAELNVVEAIRDALAFEMERDERVIVLGLDVGALGGVFRATQGLRERFGPDRVVDTPLAEGGIVGSALGLAISGLVPVAEIQPDAVEAQFVQTPGIKIVCPATPSDARGMLLEAIGDPDPVLFLEPQRLYRKSREEVPADD